MVTVNNKHGDSGSATFEFVGLSGDTKPTGKWGGTAIQRGTATEIIGAQEIAENSLFLELDTGKLYYYYEGEWCELGTTSGGGGGGGGTGSNELVVNAKLAASTFTVTEIDTSRFDVMDAIEGKRPVRLVLDETENGTTVVMYAVLKYSAGALFIGGSIMSNTPVLLYAHYDSSGITGGVFS